MLQASPVQTKITQDRKNCSSFHPNHFNPISTCSFHPKFSVNTDSDTGSHVYIEMGPSLTLHLMKPARSSKSFFPLYYHHIQQSGLSFFFSNGEQPSQAVFPKSSSHGNKQNHHIFTRKYRPEESFKC